MKKKILITGGAGYIGSMLATALIEKGHIVTVVDILKYSSNSINHLFVNKNFIFLKEDITKINVLKKIIKHQDFIIPLAGLVGAPLCEKFKKEAVKTNLTSVKLLLKIIKKNKKLYFQQVTLGMVLGKKINFVMKIHL